MVSILYVIGVLNIIIAVISGFLLGSFWGFIASIFAGVVSAIVYWTLANILEKQDMILYILEQQERIEKSSEKTICTKCNKEYDVDYLSCPHCGYKG